MPHGVLVSGLTVAERLWVARSYGKAPHATTRRLRLSQSAQRRRLYVRRGESSDHRCVVTSRHALTVSWRILSTRMEVTHVDAEMDRKHA